MLVWELVRQTQNDFVVMDASQFTLANDHSRKFVSGLLRRSPTYVFD